MEEEASLGVNEATQLTEPEAAENVSKADSGVVDASTLSRDDSSSESAEMRTEQEVTRLAAAAEGAEGSADSLAGLAAGSDSGVEGCGRAPSSAGGERSCASSVVSCGSGCGSESSSLAAAPRARRRVSVPATDPKRGSPVGASTPRPATAPRGPNLATRDRARSREKPTPPEKPRPLTPKPRIRPTADLPNLVRESPALRAKPTKTSAARCRTPSSPGEERRWGSAAARLPAATAAAADKYGTLPRRRRDAASSGRAAPRPRVRIYAEKTAQTALTGTDLDAALAGLMPVMDCRLEVTRCNKGVQASSRDSELSRLTAAAAAAEALANEEKERRVRVESQLAAERAARLAAIAELERNSQKLLELAGAGAGANADGCLRALEEQLRSAGEVAAKQRSEIDALRQHCDKLHVEGSQAREAARVAVARLEEAEREAAEMQEFLAAETGALGASLRDADSELQRLHHDLATRRAECRHLVRLCEQRRQEAMTSVARARSSNQATVAIDLISKKIAELTEAVTRGTGIREPNGISPDEENRTTLLTAIAHAFKNSVQAPVPQNLPQTPQNMPQTPQNLPQTPQMGQDEDKSHISEDNDNSADLLDSETEPCLVTDPECAEEWWSGAEGAGGWSNDELSPERENCDDREGECPSERESLRSLSAAIALRQRSEDDRGGLSQRVAVLSDRVDQLARALHTVYTRDNAETPDKNVVTSAIVKKLAELDLGRQMVEHYKHNVDVCKQQGQSTNEDEDLEFLEEELLSCDESSRRDLYEALDAALAAFTTRQHIVKSWSRLAAVHRTMERLAFAVAAPPKPNHTVTVQTTA